MILGQGWSPSGVSYHVVDCLTDGRLRDWVRAGRTQVPAPLIAVCQADGKKSQDMEPLPSDLGHNFPWTAASCTDPRARNLVGTMAISMDGLWTSMCRIKGRVAVSTVS